MYYWWGTTIAFVKSAIEESNRGNSGVNQLLPRYAFVRLLWARFITYLSSTAIIEYNIPIYEDWRQAASKNWKLVTSFLRMNQMVCFLGSQIIYSMILNKILRQRQIRKSTSSKRTVTPMYLFNITQCPSGKLAYNKKWGKIVILSSATCSVFFCTCKVNSHTRYCSSLNYKDYVW